ncbi:unnamed protein product [Lactuca saligna]|uniref:Uncharacterized protein n=1 Tax=Lactuca saligna TaxID=75948 RepID=A0AA35YTI8_LACSI|nr:unnamed protein product [Lactuca saligna]
MYEGSKKSAKKYENLHCSCYQKGGWVKQTPSLNEHGLSQVEPGCTDGCSDRKEISGVMPVCSLSFTFDNFSIFFFIWISSAIHRETSTVTYSKPTDHRLHSLLFVVNPLPWLVPEHSSTMDSIVAHNKLQNPARFYEQMKIKLCVAVSAKVADFSLGTNTGGSVRVHCPY